MPPFFSQEGAIRWHAETLEPLCREAADRGGTIILEHQPHGGSDQLETIAAVLDQIPGLGFHLDSGHANLELEYDRWDEYLDRLEVFAPKRQYLLLSRDFLRMWWDEA